MVVARACFAAQRERTHLQGYVTHLLLSEPTLTVGPGLGRPTNGMYDTAQAIILPTELIGRYTMHLCIRPIFMFAMALSGFG
jgi:hypothetical protein